MKKRFFGSLLLGVLIASTGVFVSCTDYDDDINELRSLIQKNTDAMSTIQAKVNDGTAVTTVAKSDNGVVVTLANGTSYTITNGKDGVNGSNGKDGVDGKDGAAGTVVTIGEDGYWYIDGVKTNYPAAGKDGVDGKDGKDGVDGKDGKDGVDGKDGLNGKDGKDGVDGKDGKDGVDGKDGLNGKDGKDGVDGKDGKDGVDGKDGLNGKDGKDGKDGIYYVPGTEGDEAGKWVKVDPSTTPATRTITGDTWLPEGTVTAIYDDAAGYLRFYNVEGGTGKNKEFVITLWSHLKSLVFEPDFYFDGIEAFDFSTYKYKKITVAPVSADVEYAYASNGAISSVTKQYNTDAPTVATAITTVAPDVKATYHLNPANAKVSKDAKDYKFIAYNKWMTRASSTDISSVFTVTKADLSKKGKVTIHARYNADALKYKAAWGEIIKTGTGLKDSVTIMALQHIQNDSVVTSDYAAVMASTWTNLELNNPKLNQHLNATPVVPTPSTPSHLYTTAAAAIAAPHTVEVAWNGTLDLRTVVNTHRSKNNGATCVQWDADATKGEVEKDGFAYSFELVGYTSGANFTSQSAHAAINPKDGYTFRPQMTVDGKQAAYGSAQNQATIDKEPVVRVKLTDTNNGNIAAVGYFKIKIVKTAPAAEKADEVEIPTVTKPDYTIACGDANTVLVKLAWHDIEEQIIAKLGISKATFEANYGLDGGNTDANQFAAATTEATALAAADKNGVVSQTTADVSGTQTEVLQWVINNQRAYTLFKSGKTSIDTYVRFTRNAGSGPQYFYVKFSWTPENINITPEPEFTNANKIKGYWYADNNATAGSGYQNIHGNVEVIGTTNDALTIDATTSTAAANDEYVFDIKNTIVGNTLDKAATMIAPYKTLAFNTGFPRAEFLDGHGLYAYAGANTAATRYTDTNYGYKLYDSRTQGTVNVGTPAAPVYNYTYGNLIATIEPTTGAVRYEKTAKAKELLNKVGHSNLANTVTARVGIFADYCTIGAKAVKNNEFDIKFLRPVDINEGTADFEDAETLGSDSPVKFQFNDWRDHDFVAAKDASKRKSQNYFQYYGQNIGGIKVKVDVPNAETDLNGGRVKLSTITKKLLFSYIAADGTKKADANSATAAPITASVNATTGVVTANYGSIHYENNGVTVGKFTVWFPVEVEYDWGTIKTWIKSTVGKTQNNARRK